MLLFQYGIYDWGDEFGKHFEFDVTRQIFLPNKDEPYQLQLTFIYDSASFVGCKSHDCWSDQYKSIKDFADHIKQTDGFKLSHNNTPLTYTFSLEQC